MTKTTTDINDNTVTLTISLTKKTTHTSYLRDSQSNATAVK